MTRAITGLVLLSGLVCAPSIAAAQDRCTRADLQAAVDGYRAAQANGSTAGLRLASSVRYVENLQEMPIGNGILQTPLPIAFHRSLLDVDACCRATVDGVHDSGVRLHRGARSAAVGQEPVHGSPARPL